MGKKGCFRISSSVLTGCWLEEGTTMRSDGPQITLPAKATEEGLQGLGPGRKASSVVLLPWSCVGNFGSYMEMLKGDGLAGHGGMHI